MLFRILQTEDAARLLEFELVNRAWFERIIPAREADFYSEAGIAQHIENCLREHQAGSMFAGVLAGPDGEIAGRTNIRFVDAVAGTSEVGYRIAEQYCGQGWASAAVRWLQEQAYGHLGLDRLQAYVSVENPASSRVLTKNGFVQRELVSRRSEVQGRWVDAHRYEHIPD